MDIHDDIKQPETVVEGNIEIPKFKASIPSYMLEGMDNHNKFLLEQISIMKNQNEWQTDMVHKIYNYTKTINGKVVALEMFRHRMEMELQLDGKWAEREEKVTKMKKWAIGVFLVLVYPTYLTVVNNVGLAKLLEGIVKF